MTTYIAFQPSQLTVPQFQANMTQLSASTAATGAYTFIITWLWAGGQRNGGQWYVNCYDQGGNWIFTLPLIGSPDGYNISMTAGYFATSLVYRVSSGNFEISV